MMAYRLNSLSFTLNTSGISKRCRCHQRTRQFSSFPKGSTFSTISCSTLLLFPSSSSAIAPITRCCSVKSASLSSPCIFTSTTIKAQAKLISSTISPPLISEYTQPHLTIEMLLLNVFPFHKMIFSSALGKLSNNIAFSK
jgi:hypothetical protein